MPPSVSLSRTPFVGRTRELAALLARLEAAGQGEGGLVLAAGEPGIGKTRLMAELAARARTAGWLVLMGRAYEAEGMPPYLPFVEPLRDHVLACSLPDLEGLLGRRAAQVARLLPELRDYLPELSEPVPVEPEGERYRLFESVTDFLLAIARGDGNWGSGSEEGTDSLQRPRTSGLLLILDDLHWADRPTLLLLLHLARRLGGARLLVVGTHRTVEIDPAHPLADLLADLSREHLAERLTLPALSVAEVAALIDGMSGAATSPAAVDAIYRGTEGNPFFVEEVVRHLRAEGRDLTSAGAASGWEVPAAVREVIGRRLARLSPPAQRLLQTAAVLGEHAAFDLMQVVSDIETEPLLDVLDETIRAGMLREEGGGYGFGHALLRQTVYEGLSLPRRQRLHLRAAAAIERLYAGDLDPHAAALAAHYRLAGPGADPERAVDAAVRAADAARRVSAWEEEVAHRQAALDLLAEGGRDDPAVRRRRCDMLLALGWAQGIAGDHETNWATLRQAAGLARKLGSAEHLARAALSVFGVPYASVGFVAEMLEEALPGLAPESRMKAQVLADLAQQVSPAVLPEQRATLIREAAMLARRLGDPWLLRSVLIALRGVLRDYRLGSFEERLAATAEYARAAVETGDPYLIGDSHWLRLQDLLEVGDLAGARAALEMYAELMRPFRVPQRLHYELLMRAQLALLVGDFDEAWRLLQEASAVRRRLRSAPAEEAAVAMDVLVRRHQGRLAEVEAAGRAAVARAGRPSYIAFLALLLCELGHGAEARVALEQLAADDFAAIMRGFDWMHAVSFLAEVCAALGDARRAAILYDVLLPYAGRNLVTGQYQFFWTYGPAAYYLGLLAGAMGRWEAAERHFNDALAMNAGMGARPWLAHTRLAFGRMLLARPGRGADRRRRAHALLAGALALYTELGAEQHAAKARALLVEPLAAALAPQAAIYSDGLSEREAQVLRLIAAGKPNREIAEELVISLNTVERHVNHIFTKTGAANRVALATYALQHGLTGPPVS